MGSKSFIFLILVIQLWNGFVCGYSLEEIARDRTELLNEWTKIAHFRGPILKDAWIHDNLQEESVCQALYNKALEAANITWPPPKEPLEGQKVDYTIGGRADYWDLYCEEEQQNGGQGYNWSIPFMTTFLERPNTCGGYKNHNCDRMMKKYGPTIITGKDVVVVGSQSPWAEASMFNAKANHVTTIEYMKIHSDYPNFTYYHPSEIARKYLDRKWKAADVAFSYSSVEHDGLGRYGDPLNPFADLESVARMRCLLKPGGHLLLGFPVSPDAVVFNAHRLYGKYRLFLMFLGWKVVDIYPNDCIVEPGKIKRGYWRCQPLILLQKFSTPAQSTTTPQHPHKHSELAASKDQRFDSSPLHRSSSFRRDNN